MPLSFHLTAFVNPPGTVCFDLHFNCFALGRCGDGGLRFGDRVFRIGGLYGRSRAYLNKTRRTR